MSHTLMALSSPQLASSCPSGLTLSDWTEVGCPWRIVTHSPRCTSHQRSIPSLPPLTSRSPSSLQARANTIPVCPLKACRRSALWAPPRASHTNSSPLPPCPWPLPPLANRVPSGLHATLATRPLCPCSRCSSVPSEASHRHTLPSSPPLASRVPSGLHATRRILVDCARPTHRRVPVVTSHTCTPC